MPTTYYNYFGSADKINLLPIRAVSFRNAVEDKNISFFNLEAESSYKITPIIKNCFDGSKRTVCYKYEANWYIPHNQLKILSSRLSLYFVNKVISTQIALGTQDEWDLKDPSIDFTESPLLEAFNSTDGMLLDVSAFNSGLRNNINFEVEGIELRNRSIIRQSGYIDRSKLAIQTFDPS